MTYTTLNLLTFVTLPSIGLVALLALLIAPSFVFHHLHRALGQFISQCFSPSMQQPPLTLDLNIHAITTFPMLFPCHNNLHSLVSSSFPSQDSYLHSVLTPLASTALPSSFFSFRPVSNVNCGMIERRGNACFTGFTGSTQTPAYLLM